MLKGTEKAFNTFASNLPTYNMLRKIRNGINQSDGFDWRSNGEYYD